MRHSLWPADYTPKSLQEHARSVAGAMRISQDDARILCNEIRNALSPVSALIDAGEDAEAEDRELAEAGLRRTVALLYAIEKRSRRASSRLARPRRSRRS